MSNVKQPNKLLQELIAGARTAIKNYEKAKRDLVGLTGDSAFVVCCQDVYLTFDLDVAGNVSNPRPCQPHLARRFTFAQATALAEVVQNKNDCKGEVTHVTLAVCAALDAQQAVLEALVGFETNAEATSTIP